MSIYVELIEKTELSKSNRKISEKSQKEDQTTQTTGGTSQTPQNEECIEPRAESSKSPSVFDNDIDLPGINNNWDEILSGKPKIKPRIENFPGLIEKNSEFGKITTPPSELEVNLSPEPYQTRSEYQIRDLGVSPPPSTATRRVPALKTKKDSNTDNPVDQKPPETSLTLDKSDSKLKLTDPVRIPIGKLRSQGMVTPNMEHKGIIEEYRHLKRILLKNISKSDKKMGCGVVITSALPGEGKTFTALNLALSLSMEKSKKILLVDADIEKGGTTQFLGVQDKKGLGDYLEDSSMDINDILLETDLDNLTVISKGIYKPHSAEVFSSERMETLVKRLDHSMSNHIVIYDAPPVLVSSATNILSGLTGQTLVVVLANQTSGKLLREVEENLVDSNSLGFVINRVAFNEKKHNVYYSTDS